MRLLELLLLVLLLLVLLLWQWLLLQLLLLGLRNKGVRASSSHEAGPRASSASPESVKLLLGLDLSLFGSVRPLDVGRAPGLDVGYASALVLVGYTPPEALVTRNADGECLCVLCALVVRVRPRSGRVVEQPFAGGQNSRPGRG